MKTKLVLAVLAAVLLSITVAYRSSSSDMPESNPKLQTLAAQGWPISDMVRKMSDDVFPNQKFFLIDNSLLFVERSGFASDYSYHHLLFDKNEKELCSLADNIAGPQMQCADASKKSLFETITKNLDKADLGLPGHTVELVYAKQASV